MGADSFANNGTLRVLNSNPLKIADFIATSNTGNIFANHGFTYQGTTGDDTLTNGTGALISVRNGNGVFDGLAGNDIFTNGGMLRVLDGNNLAIRNIETVNNTASGIILGTGNTIFDGGANGALFRNAGTVTSTGRLTIRNFVATNNTGNIFANGGLTYQGTTGDDTLTNGMGALISVGNGNGVFDGLAGNDIFTNNGILRVLDSNNLTVRNIETVNNNANGIILGTGNTTFANGALFRNAGRVTSTGKLTIRNFGATSNTGNIFANGGLTYQGTTGDDTLTNGTGALISVGNGNGVFDGLAGNDIFTNNGILRVLDSNNLTVRNIETVNNNANGIILGTGNTTFANGALFRNAGRVTSTGKLTIRNFGATSNTGNIFANGGLTYQGTTGDDTLTNGMGALISVGNGNGVFDGLAGNDIFTNGGMLRVLDGNNLAIRNIETVNNTASGTILGTGNTSFDGGANGALFRNAGTVTSTGKLTIRNFGAARNTGNIFANGGLIYQGGLGDTFTNSATGMIRVDNGAGLFDGMGADSFANNGTLRVLNSNPLKITDFIATSNTGNIIANQGFTYQGTAGDGTLTNGTGALISVRNGNGVFDGLAGNDIFTNRGKLQVRDGNLAVRNIETVNNTASGIILSTRSTVFDGGANGALFRNAGKVISKGKLTIRNFDATSNTGKIFAKNGFLHEALVGQSFVNGQGGVLRVFGGTTFNSTFENRGIFNIADNGKVGDVVTIRDNFVAMNTGRSILDLDLHGSTGKADQLDITGQVQGNANNIKFNFINPADTNYQLYDVSKPLEIVNSAGGNVVLNVNGEQGQTVQVVNGDSQKFYDFGLIDYIISNKNGSVSITNQLNETQAAGLAGGFSATLASIAAIFDKPVSGFVSSCKPDNDGKGFGTWFRGTGGRLNSDLSATVNGTGTSVQTKNSTDFLGLQGGFDAAACDVGSMHATIHGGVTIGQITGTTNQTNGGLKVDFDSPFVGVYSALIIGNFTADALVRYDFHNFDLSHMNTEIIAPGTKTHGSTISGNVSTSYSFRLGDSVIFRPAAGVTIANTSVDSFTVNGTGVLSPKDQMSIMAFAGATVQGTLPVSDHLILLPFVSANVYNDFGDVAQSTFTIGKFSRTAQVNTVGTFGQIGAGMNFFIPAASGTKAPFVVGGVRWDGQFGKHLDGWALTGNVRLQF